MVGKGIEFSQLRCLMALPWWRTPSCVPRRDSELLKSPGNLCEPALVAHALLRTAATLLSPFGSFTQIARRQECRRGTQECVRHQTQAGHTTKWLTDFPQTPEIPTRPQEVRAASRCWTEFAGVPPGVAGSGNATRKNACATKAESSQRSLPLRGEIPFSVGLGVRGHQNWLTQSCWGARKLRACFSLPVLRTNS